jgi:hypothetical protein
MVRIGLGAHHDGVIAAEHLVQPLEELRTLEAPVSRPALGHGEPVEAAEEVDRQIAHG